MKDKLTYQSNHTLENIICILKNSILVNRFSKLFVFFVIFITPFSDINSQTTLYTENMYNGTGGTSGNAIATHETNNRFNEDGLTYSGSGDMRNTSGSSGYAGASGTWNVLLNANTENFIMTGLDLTTCSSNIVVSFGIYKSILAENGSNLILEYSTAGTGGPWTGITWGTLPTGAGTATWYSRSSSTVIPSTANTLRWRSTNPTAGEEFRIDDVNISCILTPANTITTGAITGAPFSVDCTTNSSGTVDFTSTGTFNAGNVYTAQLSNSAGNFASPTNIGTLASTANSGTISITIPAATFSGAGYKIRIVSSNPSVTGSLSAAFTVTLSGSPCSGGGGILFLETFDESDNSTSGIDNVGGVSWTTVCPGSLDANDYSKVVSGVLENRDSNGPATLTSGSINVSSCPDAFYVKLDITSSGDMEPCRVANGFDEIDFVALELKIDGASWVGAPSSYNCGATDIYNSTATIFNTDATSASFSYNSGCMPIANTLELKIVTQNWAADEYWRIDNIEVGCTTCVILPIQLVYFDAVCSDEKNINFSWQTASEKENDYFLIEKSKDAVNFEYVASIKGAGNSSTNKNYTAVLPYNRFENYYYRLTQVDFNGTKTHSKTISPSCSYENKKIQIYPNPTNGEFVINGFDNNSTITIFDNIGQLIKVIETDKYSQIIDLSENASGVYFVQVTSEYRSETIKINVIR